jgi:plasmid stabilization system protein ParE
LKLRVVFAPQARAEYVEVQSWYLEHGGLPAAERFNAEFARVSGTLAESPKLWAEYEPGIRRALFRRFPYALHYMLQSDHVYVLALTHQRRRPGYWRNRIPQ